MIQRSPAPRRKLSVTRIFSRFLQEESAGGVVMILATAFALVLANSHLAEMYSHFIDIPVFSLPLKDWVKDVLMVLFFLTVGMELKREMVEGLLAQKGQVVLPLVAALGGMALPALIYTALNHSDPLMSRGWAIPSATDIAFALCVLMLFGRHTPQGVKILLLAIAIFDDLGAIIIIALFYSSSINLFALGGALLGIALLAALGRLRVAALWPYLLLGVYLWFCLHAAGIHTTIAGAAVGFAIPMRDRANSDNSPLNKCMHFLHPWVVFGVLPVFAFVSAGVNFSAVSLRDMLASQPLGIALGLFIGKQVGILGAIACMVKAGFARLPEGTGWRQMYAVSIIAGIGFTMSLFISLLAFADPHAQDMAKIGVIAGSLLSAAWGALLLQFCQKR